MCTSVCATWVVLSVWHLFFGGVDIVLLSVLMGGSAVGGMYYLFSKVPKRYGIFRFPLLLTLFFAIYAFVMQKLSLSSREFAILIGLWIIVGIVFIYKKKSI